MIAEVFIHSAIFEIERALQFSSLLILWHRLIDEVNSKVAKLRVKLILQSECKIEPAILWPEGLLLIRQSYECCLGELCPISVEQIVKLVNWKGKKDQQQHERDCGAESRLILIFTIPSQINALPEKIYGFEAFTSLALAWIPLNLLVFRDLRFLFRPRFGLSGRKSWGITSWRYIYSW